MRTEDQDKTDAGLSRVLGEWRLTDEPAPRFSERVWQRIAREQARTPAPWLERLGQRLKGPSLAVSYLALLLLVGMGAGYWRARVQRAETVETLGARYVQMMAPYR